MITQRWNTESPSAKHRSRCNPRLFRCISLVLVLVIVSCTGYSGWVPRDNRTKPQGPVQTEEIIVDDFMPQPYQGETVYYYNRLEGDRGSVNDSLMVWGKGQVRCGWERVIPGAAGG